MSTPATALPVPTEQPLRALAAPLVIVAILAMMILPLPRFLLDLLFTFNIALAMVVLFASLYTRRPLEFAAFPTVLLVATLLRLSLNVASTRIVLLHGHTGSDAAGKVIEAFGHFLVGGNFAVGLVVFTILTVINFVVITKGAGRISEVSARFTLDAMPGKQMAIDADLNAGLIGEPEARKRRAEVTQEAEFFGAMDGASKFVRGDAVAGILILVVNIVGGLAIGIVEHGLGFGQAVSYYVLLAIGDGLVAQIPALVISTAAGLVVSRVGNGQDVGSQIAGQLFSNPQPLAITAGVLGLLGLIPGMPHVAFLTLAGICGASARRISLARTAKPEAAQAAAATPAPAENRDASWDDLEPVDALGLEVGFRLVPLVDRNQNGELLKRIKAIRKRFAQDVGFLPPAVHIRDNLELKPSAYRVLIRGVPVAEGELQTQQFLAINPGRASGTLNGLATRDPAFGLPATWIDAASREGAQMQGFTVVDAPSVAATHFSHILQTHASRLLGRTETQGLLDHFSKSVPGVVTELVPKVLPLGTVQRVLQNLLDDAVPVRDLRTILEVLIEHGGRTQDATELTALVRIAMGPAIAQSIFGASPELSVMAIEPELERVLGQALGAGDALGLEPSLAEALVREAAQAATRREAMGEPTVLVVPDRIRNALARMFRRGVPNMKVLGHAEIPDSKTLRVSAVIGARK